MRSRVQLSRGGLALLSRLGQFDRNRLDSQIAVCAGIGTKGQETILSRPMAG